MPKLFLYTAMSFLFQGLVFSQNLLVIIDWSENLVTNLDIICELFSMNIKVYIFGE